jgi:hypothetical protein
MHTLRYLKPGHQSHVYVRDTAGLGPCNRDYEHTPSTAARHINEEVLHEADPKPRVERDHQNQPVIPTLDQYRQYFQDMQSKYIKDQLGTAHERWQKAADEAKTADGTKKTLAAAQLTALSNEIAAAKEVLHDKDQLQEWVTLPQHLATFN